MALTSFGDRVYFPLRLGVATFGQSYTANTGSPFLATSASNSQIEALNDKLTFSGYLQWAGDVTGKTVSKIHLSVGAVTTNLTGGTGSTLRVGIQPVANASAVRGGTGTWSQYADITADLTASAVNSFTMTSGSPPTYSTGDLIAVVADLTVDGGADFNLLSLGCNNGFQDPSVIGPGGSLITGLPNVILEASDGTYGIIRGGGWAGTSAEVSFDSGTTYDEYGVILRVPVPCRAIGVFFGGNPTASSSEGTFNVYQGSVATPGTAVKSISGGTSLIGAQTTAGRFMQGFFSTPLTVAANTDYIVTLRATTLNNIEIPEITLGTAGFGAALPGGTNCYQVYRTGGTGAFSSNTGKYHPAGFIIDQFDTGGAGGATVSRSIPLVV